MTRVDKRFVSFIALVCLYVLFVVLDTTMHPLTLSAAPASVRYEWAYQFGQYLDQLVILPGLAVFGWPLGLWLWRRGELSLQHRTALRVSAVCLGLAATVFIAAYLNSWLRH